MAVVFSYPKIDSGDLQSSDRLIISQMNVNGNPTKSLTLGALTSYIGAIPTGGTVTAVATSGTVSGLTLTGGIITSSGTVTLGGTLSLTSANVTTGLGFTPYNATNPSGFTSFAEPGIFSGGGTPTLASGVTELEIRTLIGAGTGDGNLTQLFAGDGINVVDPIGPNPTTSIEYDGTRNFINKCPNGGSIGQKVKEEDKLIFNSFDATPANRKVTQISALNLGLASVMVTLDSNDLNNIDTTPIELIPALPNGDLIKVLHASFKFTNTGGPPGFAFVDDLTGSMNGVPFFTLPKAVLNNTTATSYIYSMSIAEAEYNLNAGSRALFLETTGATGGTGVGELRLKITYQQLSFV